ncbi:ATP-binding protein [Actinoplanes sp. NPDC026619]|uniref:ATP-binding protein n=1 Tax=Actinoplanes sp. NPDC026619 TaxID=3155798 RepID=UPI003410F93A
MAGQPADSARFLADLASALTVASTDLERVVQCAARAASELIGDGAVVRLANDAGVFDRAAVHHPDAASAEMLRLLLPRQHQRVDDGFAAEVHDNGGVVVRNNLTEEAMREIAGPLWPHLKHLRFGSILMVPLIADGTYLGNLSLGRKGRDRPFTDQDSRLAVDVAARVALAVATARSVARLRAERENYRLIVETCSEGVWKIDAEGRTTFVNDRMAEILGVAADQMHGRPASSWQPDDEEGQWWRLSDGRPHERRLRHGDGHSIWVQLSVSALPAPADTTPEWLIMVTDITDRIRGRELGERLAQMQRLDSIGRLAGGIAHDFNNLLSIIGGATELLLTEVPAASSAADLARQVICAVDQGAALTRQLLAFGRGQPGHAETVDVLDVIAELEPMLRRTLGEHIELECPVRGTQGASGLVRIDQGQLHQVIVNLTTNARDAMNAGGRLRIDCERVLVDRAELGPDAMDDDGGDGKAWFVRLAVSDTGTGMDATTLRRAFEPFYTTKAAGHGTGLGLAGVYGIVRSAGGLVVPYSEPGHGTTIKIYLPATEAPIAGPDAVVPEVRDRPAARAGSLHVLVVEDNPALAEVTCRLLRPGGYTVTAVHGPQAALALLNTTDVDLVITDVVMPDLTGPELVAEIHRRRPGLPVVYTSGYTAGVLGERAHLSADAILLEKPFTRAGLTDAVARALDETPPGISVTGVVA